MAEQILLLKLLPVGPLFPLLRSSPKKQKENTKDVWMDSRKTKGKIESPAQQLPTNHWSSNPAVPGQYAAISGSCMAPHTNLPSFMGLANPNHLQPGPHQTPTSAAPLATSQGTTPMVLSTGVQPGSIPGAGLNPCHDTERRSSSIASLRLKAREHSAAMGILSVYGKS